MTKTNEPWDIISTTRVLVVLDRGGMSAYLTIGDGNVVVRFVDVDRAAYAKAEAHRLAAQMWDLVGDLSAEDPIGIEPAVVGNVVTVVGKLEAAYTALVPYFDVNCDNHRLERAIGALCNQ